MREHCDAAIRRPRPRLPRAVPVEFDAVAIRVAQVERFADAVIGGAFEGYSRFDEPAQGVGQRRPRGVNYCNVVKAGCSRRRRRTTLAFPCIQPDVMVVAARRNKRRVASIALGQFKAQHTAIEPKSAFEVSRLEMDVADSDFRIYGWHGF